MTRNILVCLWLKVYIYIQGIQKRMVQKETNNFLTVQDILILLTASYSAMFRVFFIIFGHVIVTSPLGRHSFGLHTQANRNTVQFKGMMKFTKSLLCNQQFLSGWYHIGSYLSFIRKINLNNNNLNFLKNKY